MAWSLRDSGARGDTATAEPPPLILLPGALGNGDSAWRIAQAFAAERRVLSITYPGGVAPELLALGLEELLRERRTGAVALWARRTAPGGRRPSRCVSLIRWQRSGSATPSSTGAT